MTFPGANATVYYNEEGEPLGWDINHDDDRPDVDLDDWRDDQPRCACGELQCSECVE